MKGTTKDIWATSFANELGRLANGVGKRIPTGTNTLSFIPKTKVPKHKIPTYGHLVCDIKPNKAERHHTCLTIGGNLIDYRGDKSTAVADLVTIKCHLKSVISDVGAKFCTTDIFFYLGTPLKDCEYMKLTINIIPIEIIAQYTLSDISINGWVYYGIKKGMYGLPHAGKIANEQLTRHLAPFGYAPVKHTPGLWAHYSRQISFTLVVNDFGIKYIAPADAEHLQNALREQYDITTDMIGAQYCGLTLAWNYTKRFVDVSMPGYVQKVPHQFNNPVPNCPQHAPHKWKRPNYGALVQYNTVNHKLPLLPPKEITRIQQIIGALLYHARAVDNTMIVALSCIASEQSAATCATASATNLLLNYATTHPDIVILYHASGM